jgi:hypothetical protein
MKIRGKINFALKYSKSNQILFVKILRCTQLLPMDNGKSSDPFVQMFVCLFYCSIFFIGFVLYKFLFFILRELTPSEKSNKNHKQRTSVKWKTLGEISFILHRI